MTWKRPPWWLVVYLAALTVVAFLSWDIFGPYRGAAGWVFKLAHRLGAFLPISLLQSGQRKAAAVACGLGMFVMTVVPPAMLYLVPA